MCGCSAPQAQADNVGSMVSPQYRVSSGGEKPRANDPCTYTIEQVDGWLIKVNCFKDGGYLTQVPGITNKQLNIYIGTLMSIQNFKGNICYFALELDEIESFITVITSMNICTTI